MPGAKKKHHHKRRENNRVLGVGRDIRDAVLVGDERPLLAVIGGAVIEADITRTIAGASNIQLVVHDPERRLLRKKLLKEKWTLKVDGLHFRFKGAIKDGPDVTMSFIEENAARLQEVTKARKVYRDQVTRAEFILSQVREAPGPDIPVRIFELHKEQPIRKEKDRQAKKDRQNESGEEHTQGEYGLGSADIGKVTVKHEVASPGEVHIIDEVLDVGMSMGASFKLLVASIMTITQETHAQNLDSGAAGRGPFSQEPGTWGTAYPGATLDVAEDARGFFQVGLKKDRENPSQSKAELCQAVQASADGSLYAQWEDESTKTVETFLGGSDVGSVEQTVKERYAFEREEGESAWANTKKLANEVHWRRFMVAGRFFYVPDTFLMRSKRQAVIDEEDPGIDSIDFEYNENVEVQEAKVKCRAKYWKVPPGCIVALNKTMGPAHGNYLVTSIEGSMFDSDQDIEVTLHKPTKPLKEPAPETRTKSLSVPGGSSMAGVPQKVAEIIAYVDEATEKGTNYGYGAGHTGSSFPGPSAEKDCSSFVSAAVHAAGYLSVVITSGEFANVFPNGEGEWVTIYGDADHVFMKVKYPDGHWRYAGTGGPTGSGGWVPDSNGISGAAGIGSKVASHPPGL